MKINTLDLDFNDKDRIADIACKVLRCAGAIERHESPSMNGWHFTFVCKKNCDLCRLVFDDQERFSRDLRRPLRTRDVLWNRKTYSKCGCFLILEC